MDAAIFSLLVKKEAEKIASGEFSDRLNKDITRFGYAALPKDYEAYLRLQHVPGLPFIRHPVREVHSSMGMKPGQVFAPKEGDALDALQKGLMGFVFKDKTKEWTPAQRNMLTRIVEDHELDEVHTAPARSMAQHGHNSPVVILREHNRVVSLAPDMKPVKDMLSNIRTTDPRRFLSLRKALKGKREDRVIQSVEPDFVYGEGDPLGSGRIKEITNKLEERAQRNETLASIVWGTAAAGGLAAFLYRALKK